MFVCNICNEKIEHGKKFGAFGVVKGDTCEHCFEKLRKMKDAASAQDIEAFVLASDGFPKSENGIKVFSHFKAMLPEIESSTFEDIRTKQHIMEAEQREIEAERKKALSESHSNLPGIVFSIEGNRGRSIEVYPYKAVITIDSSSLGAIVTGNATDGAKTIYFSDIIGVQYKSPGMTIGYLQLETASHLGDKNQSNFFSENTFTFGEETQEIKEMYDYIIGVLDVYKSKCFECIK